MMGEKFVMNVERKKKMENDSYKDLSDGEVLDLIFSKFDFDENDVADPTEQLMSKIDTAMNYKKFLADVLYQDALAMNRSELQDVSFYGEETTDKWTLENLQIQFVKDQMEFYESDNLDHQVEETWEKINANDN
jgi:hypothetical protein